MPIFFQHDIDECTRMAIWKIEEDESFFLQYVPLHREISHPHKRLQHLAGRYLLKSLFPDFPLDLIKIADTRKPYLEGEPYHFSISHCGDFAAVIVSKENSVGVDIEMVSEKINRIKHKYSCEEEWSIVNQVPAAMGTSLVRDEINDSLPGDAGLTLIWSCKESVFKWYGSGGVDFREHIQVQRIVYGKPGVYTSIIQFKKSGELFLNVRSLFFKTLCLSYVYT